jgi:hypothetical protein
VNLENLLLDVVRGFTKALETDSLPLDVIYKSPEKTTFEETLDGYIDDKTPVCKRTFDPAKLSRWVV